MPLEPDSDHNNLSSPATIIEAMAHYMTVFSALDYFLPKDKNLEIIEQEFFGREMRNILGNSDASRYERHERFETWCDRLISLGFSPVGNKQFAWEDKPLLVASAWKIALG